MATPLTSKSGLITPRLWQTGLLAAVVAVVGNLVARAILLAIFPVTPGFMPFTLGPIIIFTTLGMVGAAIAFVVVSQLSPRPAATYTWVALVALVLSCIPDVMFALDPAAAPVLPDAAPGAPLDWLLLIVFHVIPALVAIWLLPRALTKA